MTKNNIRSQKKMKKKDRFNNQKQYLDWRKHFIICFTFTICQQLSCSQMKLVNNITKGSWMSQNVDTVYPNTIQNVAVEQEIFTFPEPPSSPPVFSRVRVARSLVFCVCFDRCLFFCPFSFDYCVVYSSITNSDYLFIFKLFLQRKRQYILRVIYKYFQLRISIMHVVLMLKDLTDKLLKKILMTPKGQ